MNVTWTVGLTTVGSLILVGLVRLMALHRAVIDHPTERSSHSIPTPRGGGLGLLIVWLLASTFLTRHAVAPLVFVASIAAVVITMVMGLADDLASQPVARRLAAHIVAGALVAFAMRGSGFGWLDPGIIASGLWVFWTVAGINVINFMDGIDGLIGLQVAIYGLFIGLVCGNGPVGLSGMALLGAAAGFLWWNWMPARIFLGDSGSGALGVTVIILGGLALQRSNLAPEQTYLPLLPIYLDALVTLLRRWHGGGKVTAPHREHLYQRLVRAGWTHAGTALVYGAASVGGVAVVLAFGKSSAAFWGYLAAVIGLGIALEKVAVPPSSSARAVPPSP